MSEVNEVNTVELAAEITIAWLSNRNNRVAADEVPTFLSSMHQMVADLAGAADASAQEQEAQQFVPAVSVRKSLASKDHIISMIDGKPYKTLRRHLSTRGLTPEEYRRRYNLGPDYPMVSENYSARRSDLAKQIGLGQKGLAARAARKAAPVRRRSRQAETHSAIPGISRAGLEASASA